MLPEWSPASRVARSTDPLTFGPVQLCGSEYYFILRPGSNKNTSRPLHCLPCCLTNSSPQLTLDRWAFKWSVCDGTQILELSFRLILGFQASCFRLNSHSAPLGDMRARLLKKALCRVYQPLAIPSNLRPMNFAPDMYTFCSVLSACLRAQDGTLHPQYFGPLLSMRLWRSHTTVENPGVAVASGPVLHGSSCQSLIFPFSFLPFLFSPFLSCVRH